uniref:Chondrosarcoma associated gene 1 n=1 Tax=Homo sapiens TaxID=9606 RepID=H9KV60_HUMAN
MSATTVSSLLACLHCPGGSSGRPGGLE